MRVLLSVLALVACTSEPTPAPEQPAPPPTASAKQKLGISTGQVDMVTLKNGVAEVPGRFEAVHGDIEIDPADPSTASGTVTIELSSWNSDLELRDDRVKTTFFAIGEHPTATFVLESIKDVQGKLDAEGDSVAGTAVGTLKWRSASVPVSAPVAIVRGKGEALHVGSEDFDISIASLGMGEALQALIIECEHESVGDAVKTKVNLTLGQAPQPAVSPVIAQPKALKVAPRPLQRELKDAPGRSLKRDQAAPAEGGGGRTLKKSGE